jgi:hypothetical protein
MYNLSGQLTVIQVVAGVRERPSVSKRETNEFQMQRCNVKNPIMWKLQNINRLKSQTGLHLWRTQKEPGTPIRL